jgi:hypothetical protein
MKNFCPKKISQKKETNYTSACSDMVSRNSSYGLSTGKPQKLTALIDEIK